MSYSNLQTYIKACHKMSFKINKLKMQPMHLKSSTDAVLLDRIAEFIISTLTQLVVERRDNIRDIF